MDIKTAAQNCVDELGLAKNTGTTYRNGIGKFIKFLEEKGILETDSVENVTMEHFIYFLPWLDKRYSKQTTGVYGAASKAFLDWLVIAKYISPSYLDSVRYQKSFKRSHKRHEDKLPRFPKKDDVDKMLNAVRLREDIPVRKQRDIALIEFLASTGCRVSEATNLNISDIDIKERTTVVTGKGSKERRVFFGPSAADSLQEYWKTRKSEMPTDPVFARHDNGAGGKKVIKRLERMTPTTARRVVKSVAEVAGIDTKKFSPHYFRHAFAIRVLSETGNLALTQDLLGHTDPKATRVYAKIHAEDLRDAHRNIFG